MGYKQKDKTMAITNYIDSNGLRLMVAQLPSGAFDLYEKYMPGSTPAGGAYLLLRWSTSSPSKHLSQKRLKEFQYQGKIDYI